MFLVALPQGAVTFAAVCDCGISGSYLFAFCIGLTDMKIVFEELIKTYTPMTKVTKRHFDVGTSGSTFDK